MVGLNYVFIVAMFSDPQMAMICASTKYMRDRLRTMYCVLLWETKSGRNAPRDVTSYGREDPKVA